MPERHDAPLTPVQKAVATAIASAIVRRIRRESATTTTTVTRPTNAEHEEATCR